MAVRIVSVVGARPQFVKLSPIHEAFRCDRYRDVVEHRILHTGQHYDYGMSGAFFGSLGIPEPDENLGVGSGQHGEQTGAMLCQLERYLTECRPDLVLLYGDTNSTLAGALAAVKLHISVAHIEAGLRSRNKAMPEEINRVLTDHVSSILFCPTVQSVRNLETEGLHNSARFEGLLPANDPLPSVQASVDHPWILNVGDVMKDAVLMHLGRARELSGMLSSLSLEGTHFAVATVHRAENTDDPKRLSRIMDALSELSRETIPVILPLHPRTREILRRSTGVLSEQVHCIEPVGYLDMIHLVSEAQLVLTDSGGLQKEAFLLKTPCLTLRDETEWVELVDAGWNRVVGTEASTIVKSARDILESPLIRSEAELYGDGRAAERIAYVCANWRRR